MAQERPNRMAEWVMLLRKNAPIARDQFTDWVGEVRAEPRILWETTAIRYLSYGIGGVLLSWGLVMLVHMFTPPPPAGAKDAAVTADFHLVCSNPDCGYNFVIAREFGFSGFPVRCDRCKKDTGVAGRRCYSLNCQGRWVAPVPADGHQNEMCPQCGTLFASP